MTRTPPLAETAPCRAQQKAGCQWGNLNYSTHFNCGAVAFINTPTYLSSWTQQGEKKLLCWSKRLQNLQLISNLPQATAQPLVPTTSRHTPTAQETQ